MSVLANDLFTKEAVHSIVRNLERRLFEAEAVVKAAQAFWETTDDEPIRGLSNRQLDLWDDLCDALNILIGNESNEASDNDAPGRM